MFEVIDSFEGDLRGAFQRLLALSAAASMPLDRDDDLSEEWWWELPQPYREVPFLADRAQMMVEDINAWIRNAGIWVFANAGIHDGFANNGLDKANGDPREAPGDYDFILLNLIHFMYALKDRPDLLSDDSVRTLVLKRWSETEEPTMELFKQNAALMSAGWSLTNVPFAGQDFARELIAAPDIPAFKIGELELLDLDTLPLSDTENHVLMTLTHYYLMNQWISQDYRGNLKAVVTAPDDFTVDDWYAYEDTPLEQAVRDPWPGSRTKGSSRPTPGRTSITRCTPCWRWLPTRKTISSAPKPRTRCPTWPPSSPSSRWMAGARCRCGAIANIRTPCRFTDGTGPVG